MKEQTGKPSSGEKGEPALQKFYVLLVVPDSRVTPDIASTNQVSTACPGSSQDGHEPGLVLRSQLRKVILVTRVRRGSV